MVDSTVEDMEEQKRQQKLKQKLNKIDQQLEFLRSRKLNAYDNSGLGRYIKTLKLQERILEVKRYQILAGHDKREGDDNSEDATDDEEESEEDGEIKSPKIGKFFNL